MKTKRSTLFLLTLVLAVFFAACSNEDKENEHSNMNNGEKIEHKKDTNKVVNENMEGMDHGDMNHSGSGEVPEGLKIAENPKFKIGSKAIIHADHMKGMNGAEATIVGAYDTTVYSISYNPTTGGKRVTNHKWIIHEEIKDASDKPYKPGDEVVAVADHMTGMKGAKAVIDSARQTTVYMIDYTSITGKKITNHKWVTANELSTK